MEENIVKEENDNVDNLLNSLSDEYLAKKKRTRIISFSIISFLVFALAVVIIVLSCVKVDLKPKFLGEALNYRVNISNSVVSLDESNEDFNKFNKIFDESFKSQYLTAIFTGKLGGYTIEETYKQFYSSNSTNPNSIWRSELGDNYVRVNFVETKQILNSNGSVYYSNTNSNKTFTFNQMYFNLSTQDSQQDLVLYIGGILEGTSSTRLIKIKVRANTHNLYKFAEKMM